MKTFIRSAPTRPYSSNLNDTRFETNYTVRKTITKPHKLFTQTSSRYRYRDNITNKFLFIYVRVCVSFCGESYDTSKAKPSHYSTQNEDNKIICMLAGSPLQFNQPVAIIGKSTSPKHIAWFPLPLVEQHQHHQIYKKCATAALNAIKP